MHIYIYIYVYIGLNRYQKHLEIYFRYKAPAILGKSVPKRPRIPPKSTPQQG